MRMIKVKYYLFLLVFFGFSIVVFSQTESEKVLTIKVKKKQADLPAEESKPDSIKIPLPKQYTGILSYCINCSFLEKKGDFIWDGYQGAFPRGFVRLNNDSVFYVKTSSLYKWPSVITVGLLRLIKQDGNVEKLKPMKLKIK